MKKFATALCVSALLALPFSASAALLGDSILGNLSSTQPVTTGFTSPAVVGAGTEFNGVVTDGFGQVWNIGVDVSDTQFKVNFFSNSQFGNISSGPNLLTIFLSDLDWFGGIPSVLNSAYTCTPAGFACGTFGGGPNVSSLGFTADTITVSFNVLRSGEQYVFDIGPQAVPEPGSMALLGLGLAGLTMVRRRKN